MPRCDPNAANAGETNAGDQCRGCLNLVGHTVGSKKQPPKKPPGNGAQDKADDCAKGKMESGITAEEVFHGRDNRPKNSERESSSKDHHSE